MKDLRLIFPCEEYKDSFLAAVQEEGAKGYGETGIDYTGYGGDEGGFDAYLKRETDFRAGKNLPEGWVPATTYWMMEGEEFIGRISLRHELTPNLREFGGHVGYWVRPSRRGMGYGKKMMGLFLQQLDKKKYPRIMLTCDDSNVASQKIIEDYGGRLEDKIYSTLRSKKKDILTRRYWIDLT